MTDPFRNYDAWLTTDRLADAQDAAYERMAEAWSAWCEEHSFPVEADNPNHPQHAICEQWTALFIAVDRYHDEQVEADLDAYIAAERAAEADAARARRTQFDEQGNPYR